MSNPILKFFVYSHLPPALAPVSARFCELATWIDSTLPDGTEKSTALRKLLEGKDAAVRAAVEATKPPGGAVASPGV